MQSYVRNVVDENCKPRLEEIRYFIRSNFPERAEVLQKFQERKDCPLLCTNFLFESLVSGGGSFFAEFLIKYFITNWDNLEITEKKFYITEITKSLKEAFNYTSFYEESAVSIHQLYSILLILCLPRNIEAGFENILFFDPDQRLTYHHSLHTLQIFYSMLLSGDFPNIITEESKNYVISELTSKYSQRIFEIIDIGLNDNGRHRFQAIEYSIKLIKILRQYITVPNLMDFAYYDQIVTNYFKESNNSNLGTIMMYFPVCFDKILIPKYAFDLIPEIIGRINASDYINSDEFDCNDFVEFISCLLVDHFENFENQNSFPLIEEILRLLDMMWSPNKISYKEQYVLFWINLFSKANFLKSSNTNFEAFFNVYLNHMHDVMQKIIPSFFPVREFRESFDDRENLFKNIEKLFQLIVSVDDRIIFRQIDDFLAAISIGYEYSIYIPLIFTLVAIKDYVLANLDHVDLLFETKKCFEKLINKKVTNQSILYEKLFYFSSFYQAYYKYFIEFKDFSLIFIQKLKLQNFALQYQIMNTLIEINKENDISPLLELILKEFNFYYNSLLNNDLKMKLIGAVCQIYKDNDPFMLLPSIYHKNFDKISKLELDNAENAEKIIESLFMLENLIVFSQGTISEVDFSEIEFLFNICNKTFEIIDENKFSITAIDQMKQIQKHIFTILSFLSNLPLINKILFELPVIVEKYLILPPEFREFSIIGLITSIIRNEMKNGTDNAAKLVEKLFISYCTEMIPFPDNYFDEILNFFDAISELRLDLLINSKYIDAIFDVLHRIINNPKSKFKIQILIILQKILEQIDLSTINLLEILKMLFSKILNCFETELFRQLCFVFDTLLRRLLRDEQMECLTEMFTFYGFENLDLISEILENLTNTDAFLDLMADVPKHYSLFLYAYVN
ncbi:hypothetical protein TVAG_198150 [Trichomonas vaginalis G3]|uniref:Uncharacterized protein n=1 Tax=Trichomonas vaginalis (strain ATCC PRA-98 / G3) TaxID=412133 RepID=A2DDK2_TRIV3|nr:armadillo (ARM) repeat-containing protein family [Trichomonas vaginalis G3]EAY21378.1 hypothetical protein TVAG_198150 [Trichomonas vaginalis G3]KAI5490591.1 armadillo (ARM) repeat-containing protein family [Trichomonas vaginalis G3]|eukprot:XP_001582364.1 hypothetical protein [Trichomonas vaginalis G3]